jgi:hypothetical protein
MQRSFLQNAGNEQADTQAGAEEDGQLQGLVSDDAFDDVAILTLADGGTLNFEGLAALDTADLIDTGPAGYAGLDLIDADDSAVLAFPDGQTLTFEDLASADLTYENFLFPDGTADGTASAFQADDFADLNLRDILNFDDVDVQDSGDGVTPTFAEIETPVDDVPNLTEGDFLLDM